MDHRLRSKLNPSDIVSRRHQPTTYHRRRWHERPREKKHEINKTNDENKPDGSGIEVIELMLPVTCDPDASSGPQRISNCAVSKSVKLSIDGSESEANAEPVGSDNSNLTQVGDLELAP